MERELKEVVACLFRSHYEMLVQVTNLKEEFYQVREDFRRDPPFPTLRPNLTATFDTRVNGTLLDYFLLLGVMLIQFLLHFFLVKKNIVTF